MPHDWLTFKIGTQTGSLYWPSPIPCSTAAACRMDVLTINPCVSTTNTKVIFVVARVCQWISFLSFHPSSVKSIQRLAYKAEMKKNPRNIPPVKLIATTSCSRRGDKRSPIAMSSPCHICHSFICAKFWLNHEIYFPSRHPNISVSISIGSGGSIHVRRKPMIVLHCIKNIVENFTLCENQY